MQFFPLQMFNYKVLDAQSMGGNLVSDRVNISRAGSVSVQYIWSSGSTPVGNLVTQGSNDGATWVDVNSQAVSGSSGTHLLNIEEPAYMFLRATYARTSGSATLDVYVNGKKI